MNIQMQTRLSSRIIRAAFGLALALPLLVPAFAGAADGPASAGAGYLRLPLGAHSIAMGEVKAALLGDPFGWCSNPAALHSMSGSGAGLFHSEWMLDDRYESLMGYHRINRMFIVGGAFTYTYRPEIQGYDGAGTETKKLKSNNYQARLGVGFSPVRAFTAGINVKYFRETLDEFAAGGAGVDLGALYVFEAAKIALGAAIENFGPDVRFDSTGEPLPVTMRVGVSHAAVIRRDVLQVTSAVDLVKPRYESIYMSAGVSVELYKAIAVRIGYCGQEYRSGDGLTMGAGVGIRDRIVADYAASSYGDLGTIHTLTLSFGMW